MSTDISAGYHTVEYMRRNPDPYLEFYEDNYGTQQDPILVLTHTGNRYISGPDEAWQEASNTFAIPIDLVVEKLAANTVVATAWTDNKTAEIATLKTVINSALTTAGYTRPNGAAIT